MISTQQLGNLPGQSVLGPDGHKIGKVVDVYESVRGAEGTFITVATGLFGLHNSFVPLREATLQGNDVVVPYDKDLIKGAPRVSADEELLPEEEARLYQHYRLSADATEAPERPHHQAPVGQDTSGSAADEAMTRSEERLRVGTEKVETGRARLVKRIVTEDVTMTVPVSREEIVVEREPITEATIGQATDAPALSEEQHEVVLHAERLVVTKETVPVERVHIGTHVVTDEQQVHETIRKEQIDSSGI